MSIMSPWHLEGGAIDVYISNNNNPEEPEDESQGFKASWLHSEFETRMDYMRPYLKNI